MIAAAKDGHLPRTKSLLEQGANPNNHDGLSITPLRAASYEGHLDVVKTLLQHNADPNIQNESRNTPLILAIIQGHTQVAQLLIKSRAHLDRVGDQDRTALMWAASRGSLDLVRMLIQRGADVNLMTGSGLATRTAWLVAKIKERTDIMTLLRSAAFASRPIAQAIEFLVPEEEDRAYVLERLRYRKDLERPYPGAVGLLSRLSTRYEIGVIANQSPGTEARLRQDGFAPYVSLCLSSAELGLKKPDAAIFQLALEQAGCDPHEAVMIGDRVDNDIRPAKALGWRTMRVLQGIAKLQEPRESLEEADCTVENLTQIEALLT